MRTTTETRNLPVKLTEDELAERAQQLAESVAEEEKQRESFAAWESTMKEAAKACTWLYTKEAAYLRRDDTGELVQVRDLRADEKQAVIGEEAVVQEPTLNDLVSWSGGEEQGSNDDDEGVEVGAEIIFPDGTVIDLADREAARSELEEMVRGIMR